ncbi:MAG: adenylate kinase [Spirochaetales bacterium]|nr:adenylate kinase [Spirochaetales bacterium]
MKMILLGPPGAGKGTMAAKIKDELNIPHISTGDLFRAAIKNQTELGVKVKAIIDRGDLVPDELTVALVKERLEEGDSAEGYILDGFPRTAGQADALAEFSPVDVVINFTVAEEDVVRRLSGRRLCKDCGAGYHVEFIPPKQEGICDKCGGELYTRQDDQIDSIKNRLNVYAESTEPLISYYTEKGLIKNIDAGQKPDDVFADVKKIIG